MNPSLAEALRHCDLQPGQTYRETVNGRTVEVRVLDDAPTPELADQVMLLPWVELRHPHPGFKVQARPGPRDLSPPPENPPDEGEE